MTPHSPTAPTGSSSALPLPKTARRWNEPCWHQWVCHNTEERERWALDLRHCWHTLINKCYHERFVRRGNWQHSGKIFLYTYSLVNFHWIENKKKLFILWVIFILCCEIESFTKHFKKRAFLLQPHISELKLSIWERAHRKLLERGVLFHKKLKGWWDEPSVCHMSARHFYWCLGDIRRGSLPHLAKLLSDMTEVMLAAVVFVTTKKGRWVVRPY